MNVLLRLYLTVRKSGWFVPSIVGGVPFPFTWQGWAIFAGFILMVAASGVLMPGQMGWIFRIALGTGYVGLGLLTFDGA